MQKAGFDLRPVRITSIEQAQLMREIRNTCREGFSRDNNLISEKQQIGWWEKNSDKIMAFLFYKKGMVIGYGALITGEDGRYYNSNAVLPRYRGRGYGRAILSCLAEYIDQDIYGQALKSNIPAIKQHSSDLWERYDEDNAVVRFRTRKAV